MRPPAPRMTLHRWPLTLVTTPPFIVRSLVNLPCPLLQSPSEMKMLGTLRSAWNSNLHAVGPLGQCSCFVTEFSPGEPHTWDPVDWRSAGIWTSCQGVGKPLTNLSEWNRARDVPHILGCQVLRRSGAWSSVSIQSQNTAITVAMARNCLMTDAGEQELELCKRFSANLQGLMSRTSAALQSHPPFAWPLVTMSCGWRLWWTTNMMDFRKGHLVYRSLGHWWTIWAEPVCTERIFTCSGWDLTSFLFS